MGSGFVNIEAATDKPGMQYIVIQNVVIGNVTRGPVSWRNADFTLDASGKKYHPVTRPGLGAIDISQKVGVAGPGQAIRGNLCSFLGSDGRQQRFGRVPAGKLVCERHSADHVLQLDLPVTAKNTKRARSWTGLFFLD